LQRRHAKILEDTWCDVDAALAVLADTRLKARTWQQDTDFQGGVLGAYNIEGGDSGDSASPKPAVTARRENRLLFVFGFFQLIGGASLVGLCPLTA